MWGPSVWSTNIVFMTVGDWRQTSTGRVWYCLFFETKEVKKKIPLPDYVNVVIQGHRNTGSLRLTSTDLSADQQWLLDCMPRVKACNESCYNKPQIHCLRPCAPQSIPADSYRYVFLHTTRKRAHAITQHQHHNSMWNQRRCMFYITLSRVVSKPWENSAPWPGWHGQNETAWKMGWNAAGESRGSTAHSTERA